MSKFCMRDNGSFDFVTYLLSLLMLSYSGFYDISLSSTSTIKSSGLTGLTVGACNSSPVIGVMN